jgi:NADP-dependent 3-hydroxy acid dehydrogenase YdfG
MFCHLLIMKPTGQVVAITGASGGIGAAAGRLLAAQGDRVVLAARRDQELTRTAEEIIAAGGEASTCVVDVTRREDLVSLVEHATARFGRLDALVANAGVATTGPLLEADPATWDAMIDVNLRGVLNGIAAALPVFSSQGHGHFLTVTSTAAIKWVPGQGVYAATKAGVRALSEVLRQEVGPDIRATMICPGATATEFTTDPKLRAQMAAIAMDPEAVAQAIAWALAQPPEIDVGEIVVRSAAQP